MRIMMTRAEISSMRRWWSKDGDFNHRLQRVWWDEKDGDSVRKTESWQVCTDILNQLVDALSEVAVNAYLDIDMNT